MIFARSFVKYLATSPIRRTPLLRRAVAYLERHSRPVAEPWMNLPGHEKYAHLPGHSSESAAFFYQAMRHVFLNPPAITATQLASRIAIVEKFENIDRDVDIKSSPVEGLAIAEAVLSLRCDGDLVECGCYTGGSTAKLSILASITGRRLFGYDSFAGLPDPEKDEALDYHIRRGASADHLWTKGEYEGTLEAVNRTLSLYGCRDSCTLVKGLFSDTLRDNLPARIALAFVDVDLASSAKDCLQAIWPRMSNNGVFFSHDAAYVKVLQAFYDPSLWRDVFQEQPPIFYGAGFGMSDAAANLGFMVKGEVDPHYIKQLTLNK